MINLMQGDCLKVMKEIPDGSVDMVLTDPPYGTTACKWDTVIDLPLMWEQLKRVTKPNGSIVMTASQPFTSALVMSNPKMFKYCWVYQKSKATNFLNAKKNPLKYHEDVLVFTKNGQHLYNPQMEKGEPWTRVHRSDNKDDCAYGKSSRQNGDLFENKGNRYPSSIISKLSNPSGRGQLHPTQKPVALMEYLIRTYTNEGETVLDFTMGSGTTGVACINTGRSFIGIELDEDYYKTASKRLEDRTRQIDIFSEAV